MQRVKIDFDNPGLPQHISAMEGDTRFFEVALYRNGKAYTVPNAIFSVMYRGPGPQNQGWYDTINDGNGKRAACTVSGNVVTCEITRQALQVPGIVIFVLCMMDADGNMLKSWPIQCDCKSDEYDSTAEVESYFYITLVSNASWTQAIQAWNDLKSTIDTTLSISGKAADAKVTGDKIAEEALRAQTAEKANADALTAEKNRAAGEEQRLGEAVTAEAERAKQAETALSGRLDALGLSVVDGALCITYDDGVSTVDIPESEAENG